MENLMLIEDDLNLGASLQQFLKDEGYAVVWVKTLFEAEQKLHPDLKLIILDWKLPDGQGIDLLKDLRDKKNFIPVIMLTARTELIDKVIGLESGAHDYMTKPFEPRELLARIRVQLRFAENSLLAQQSHEEKKFIQAHGIHVDLEQRQVTFEGHPVELTKMEFDFLSLLISVPGKVFSRDEILNKVWGFENFPSTRTVDTHVLQLRQKLKDDLIETVRGIGYKMKLEHPTT
jgi:DNA-binding response OmpR family regulator